MPGSAGLLSASHSCRSYFAAEVSSSLTTDATLLARQILHLLPVADFLPGHGVDRRSDAVKDDDRTLCVHQARLIFLVELFAGFKVEIFARLAAPIDLAFAVEVGLYPLLEFVKERVHVLYRSVRFSAGIGAALSIRVVKYATDLGVD